MEIKGDMMGYRRIIFTILSICMMVTIFMFSSKNADESTKASHRVGYAIARVIYDDFEEMDETEQLQVVEKIDFPIRKCAHFFEYAVLGVFLFGAIYDLDNKKTNLYYVCLPQIIGILYSCTDEIHQLFVPGRAGRIMDVGIDSLGCMLGILISVSIVQRVSKKC